MIQYLKNKLIKFEKIKFLFDEGFQTSEHFKHRVLCFVFQRLFRVNSNCNFQVHFTSQVLHPEKIKLGRRVRRSFLLSGNCYIQANNGIEIGNNTIFASHVKLISANHDLNILNRHSKNKPITIGENCWIGTGVVILPGVNIGNNVIIGANSVVTKSYEGLSVIAGNPAVLIRKIE